MDPESNVQHLPTDQLNVSEGLIVWLRSISFKERPRQNQAFPYFPYEGRVPDCLTSKIVLKVFPGCHLTAKARPFQINRHSVPLPLEIKSCLKQSPKETQVKTLSGFLKNQ